MHHPIRFTKHNLADRQGIHHPSLFKEGVRVVNQTPQNHHTGEKWVSDKKRNKTQQTSYGRCLSYIIIK